MIAASEVQRIADEDIIPSLFPEGSGSDHPVLVILAGGFGASPKRALRRSLEGSEAEIALISGSSLRPFHPEHSRQASASSAEAEARVDDAVADWLGASLRHAEGNRRSIAIDGVSNSDLAVALATQFRSAGFDTRLVAVASPVTRMLLATTSSYAATYLAGQVAPLFGRPDVEASAADAASVVSAGEGAGVFDRVMVFDDRGGVVDGRASEAFDSASRRVITGLEAAQWLGELRRLTEYAREQGQPSPGLVDVLCDLHELALRDVTPNLPVPRNSEVISIEEGRLAANLAGLRRLQTPATDSAPTTSTSGPVVVPPDRGRGPSR